MTDQRSFKDRLYELAVTVGWLIFLVVAAFALYAFTKWSDEGETNTVQACINGKLADFEERYGGLNDDLRERAAEECDQPRP